MISHLLLDERFWVAVAFVLFVIAIFKPVKSILINKLDEEIDLIKKSIDESEKVKTDAQNLLFEIKKRQKNLIIEIDNINKKIKSRIEFSKKEMMQKFEHQMIRRKELNQLKIKQMENETINLIKQIIIDLTIKSTRELINNNLDLILREKMIQESLKEFKSSIRN